jgi:signal transduction histidine kinase
MILKFSRQNEAVAEIIMGIGSFFCLSFAMVWLIRLFRFIKETFYLLIIAGTTIAAICIIAGLIVNYFIYHNRISFPGLATMQIGMLVETVFLSAALGYRLKMAYREKEVYQQSLLEETKRNEELATQTAILLRKELDIRNWQNQISRDLHDDIGASLSSIHVYSSVAAKAMNNNDEKARDAIHQINQNAIRVMENMSDIVWAINTNSNESIGLESKLKNFGSELLNPLNIECIYRIDKEAEKKIVHIEARKNILLIAKEAMNNIAKYSDATKATIQLSISGVHLQLEISDNGKGFEIDNNQNGNGLHNMRQRTEAIGGTFLLNSANGNGTFILCKVPLTSISDD